MLDFPILLLDFGILFLEQIGLLLQFEGLSLQFRVGTSQCLLLRSQRSRLVLQLLSKFLRLR